MTDLFGHEPEPIARARTGDLDTSHQAAEEVSTRILKLQADVLAYAVERGSPGFIDPDLNSYFGVHSSTYRTRRAELVGRGLIEDSGERVALDPDGKGRKHALWRVTDRGRAENLRLSLDGLSAAA